MMNIKIATFLLVLAVAACQQSQKEKVGEISTDSSRNELGGCWGVAVFGGVKVCDIRFDQLLANPSEFDGSYIRLTGYPVASHGYTYLFQSKDQFFYSGAKGGVDLLIGPSDQQKFQTLISTSDSPISVVGRFDRMSGRLPGSLGTLSGKGLEFYAQPLPWDRPSPVPKPTQ